MAFATDESVWDEFLSAWPLERLRTMTLEEYTQSGNKDTFTYWMEARLDKYGSIWGGSAFKFAIYSRADKEPRKGDAALAYSDDYAWYRRFGDTPQSAFEVIRAQVVAVAEAARHDNLEDIGKSELGQVYRWKIAFHYQDRAHPSVVCVFLREPLLAFLGLPLAGNSKTPRSWLQREVMARRPDGVSVMEFSADVWDRWKRLQPRKDEVQKSKAAILSSPNGAHEHAAEYAMISVNKILFGPPGTGKTFRTVNEALAILDPTFLPDDAVETGRSALKRRFDALVAANRIRFVTFHQSFSYEDFVEGIRATTDEATGGLRYEVEDGIFKQVCEAARSRAVVESDERINLDGRRIWKMSLGEAVSEANIYDECIAENRVLLGFGSDLDYTGIASRKDIVQRLHDAGEDAKSSDYAVTALDLLVRKMKVGDLIVVSEGNLKFRAIGEVTGEYQHLDRDGADTYSQYRPVHWLRRYDPAQPYTAVMKNRFSQMSIYELRPGSIDMEKLAALLAPEPMRGDSTDAYVLIIDEINRGNISRIFGELITLIEPSRREGAEEAIEVVLPYSKERFSVPSNVHLIGTMNTADRSLAGMDVALRRRFEFIEVLPDPSTLEDVVVEGVPIARLLTVVNERIEVLMGRDYMLGHAYFLGLKKEPAIETLGGIFRDKILPLLQEYFYDDWQKIAWVLNDHRKPEELRFVIQVDAGAKTLFGEGVELPNEARLWQVNEEAFDEPAAYQAIISVPKASA